MAEPALTKKVRRSQNVPRSQPARADALLTLLPDVNLCPLVGALPPPKVFTLLVAHERGAGGGGRVLLGMKKRGPGTGKWNGFGGKLHANETMVECAARELHEESGYGERPCVEGVKPPRVELTRVPNVWQWCPLAGCVLVGCSASTC